MLNKLLKLSSQTILKSCYLKFSYSKIHSHYTIVRRKYEKKLAHQPFLRLLNLYISSSCLRMYG